MSSIKVIVIDDDDDYRTVLTEFLKLREIEVLATGCNGKEAVELYKKYRPDIVLMDLMMPEYNGIYGLEKLQKMCPDVKVIMISASDDIEIKNRLSESKNTAFIQKPFGIDNVIEIIRKFMISSSTISLFIKS